MIICCSEFDAERLMGSTDWNHICLLWDREIGLTRYYLNGNQLDYHICNGGRIPAGNTLQLGGGRRTEHIEMTDFYLWNRELAEYDITYEASKCDGGMRQPIVRWRDFYEACRGDNALTSFVRTPS